MQVSAIAEELMKTEYDVVRIIFNRFQSAISFKPTIATVLSPDALEKEVEAGGKLDQYETEGPDRAEMLQDLAEFQLAVVRLLCLTVSALYRDGCCCSNAGHVIRLPQCCNLVSTTLRCLLHHVGDFARYGEQHRLMNPLIGPHRELNGRLDYWVTCTTVQEFLHVSDLPLTAFARKHFCLPVM